MARAARLLSKHFKADTKRLAGKPLPANREKAIAELMAHHDAILARISDPCRQPIEEKPLPDTHKGKRQNTETETETEKVEGGKPPAELFVPLTSWNDILSALNEPHGKAVWKNDDQTRNKIRKLNNEHGGPIIFPQRQGKQPSVDKGELVTWWNGLKAQFDARADEVQTRAESARLTVTGSHNYGTTGTVVPGIGGSVKGKRGKRNGEERSAALFARESRGNRIPGLEAYKCRMTCCIPMTSTHG